MNQNKLPLSLFLWLLRRYTGVSLICFIGYGTILWIITEFTNFIPKEFFFVTFFFLFIFGFLGSIFIFIFILFLFLKPLAIAFQKIEYLAQLSFSDSSPSTMPHQEMREEDPDDIFELNKNLHSIYKNIKDTNVKLLREKADLKAITESVSDAIIAVDTLQKVIFTNPQSKKLFTTASDESQNSIYLSELIRTPEIINNCKKCLATGEPTNFELNLKVGEHKQDRLFEINITPLTHSKNEIEGAVIVFFDITEIRNTEKSHIDFVSNVSHELKTPLTSIQGFVETMQSDLKEKKYNSIENFLNIVNRNVARLIELIDDLLSLSHIDSISALDKQEVSTREVTTVACETIPTKNHHVNFTFKVDTVLASRQWLEQIIYNLVNNAVKYTPAGSNINVIWEKHPHFILLTIKDDGEGIPLQHQSRIFERFYRVQEDRSRDKKGGGTGIGLSIVKQAMEKHGGNVYLTSRRRGKGAKFTCTFPR